MAETAPHYVFATDFEREEERLALGERLWDPGTQARLAEVGVGPGTRCLEVGAGRGSIAAWMAGRGAEVTAVDIDTSRLTGLHGVRVRQADVTTDDIGRDYDLVHARLVVQHVADRASAVRWMAAALRPGGHLVLEDTDSTPLFDTADGIMHERVKRAAYAEMTYAGYHPRCGLLDIDLMTAVGLVDVRAEGRAEVVEGGGLNARWFALWLEHLRPAMIARGRVDAAEIDAAVADLATPGHRWLSQVMVTVTGRKVA
ncbi:methyltransferase domain-containing protein [Actinokineospora auranticolor]|uniref:Methyltransferase family protein n=1 Tax=Actinokineospora auranticolor TaxID=155976 RepID=A0A2S6GFS9_9PSEU|nr:methyltransferase domain-containing protein [Actinokineospora auranticolor]PPK64074.1 methyltransferase family protein [Actinokineospora auranticolor]